MIHVKTEKLTKGEMYSKLKLGIRYLYHTCLKSNMGWSLEYESYEQVSTRERK